MRPFQRRLPPTLAVLAVLAGLAAPVCAQEAKISYGPGDAAEILLIRSTTDIEAFEPVLRAFQVRQPGLRIDYEQWGSNNLYELARTACKDGAAPADMVISSSIDQLVKLVNDGCAQSYRSVLTEQLSADLNWRDELFGVTREPAVMVYNRDAVSPENAPRSRFDLIDLLRPPDSPFIGRVATYDIEASGLGYLFAFADAQQATTFGSLLEAFGRSGAVATCCSAEIIDAVAAGQYLIAYNVLGSYALARAAHDKRLAVVAPQDYTLVLARAAMIPKRAKRAETAGAFLDFLLSAEGRQALARSHLVISLDDAADAELDMPDGVASVLRPIPLSPALLVGLDRHKRNLFIAQWRAALKQQP
ncbi:MAG: ABC transporter substrate-binding protein [Hyphomicrobiales bacterium]|nr:ABC transporter substrate-binding protein [Hyphomicrobiales bacterium]